ncbi:hypothetical protein BD779DRAFT_1671481 [Infundibulicybe gibba]|nr:hypothetical protein BD779DRAFT_1671481 [Infundibulicybe gibba]
MNNASSSGPLDPPHLPFGNGSQRGGSPIRANAFGGSSMSLSVNYLPSKFSNPLPPSGVPRRRRGKSGKGIDPRIGPKRGGGTQAFKTGQSRIPGQDDEEDELSGWLSGDSKRGKRKLRWNGFKWVLFMSNTLLAGYSITALVFCLTTWFDVWPQADIVRVGNRPELIISTIAAGISLLAAIIGYAGILLNNRSFLAIYTFILWICFALIVTPGYIAYRRKQLNLEGKVNAQWSRDFDQDGRLRVQNALQCCGYFNPFVEATISPTCYARSILPGCKLRYLNFQRMVLDRWSLISFALVPLHIGVMVSALLCSNHVTYRFGKGMMPKAYRLSLQSMAVIMDNYTQQLAEQYGWEVANDIRKRSVSNLNLGAAYKQPPNQDNSGHHRYDTSDIGHAL